MKKVMAPNKTEKSKIQKMAFNLVEILRSEMIVIVAVEKSYVAIADPMGNKGGEIFRKLKNLDDDIYYPVFVNNLNDLREYVPEISDTERLLASSFWPGMLNIEFQARDVLPNNLGSSMVPTTLMARKPKNSLLNVVSELMGPVIYTTLFDEKGGPVNLLSKLTPENKKYIEIAVDSGALKSHKQTSIISCVESKPKMIREGSVTFVEIKQVLPSLLRI